MSGICSNIPNCCSTADSQTTVSRCSLAGAKPAGCAIRPDLSAIVSGNAESVRETLFSQPEAFNSCAALFLNMSRGVFDPSLDHYHSTGDNAVLYYENFLAEAQQALPESTFQFSCIG